VEPCLGSALETPRQVSPPPRGPRKQGPRRRLAASPRVSGAETPARRGRGKTYRDVDVRPSRYDTRKPESGSLGRTCPQFVEIQRRSNRPSSSSRSGKPAAPSGGEERSPPPPARLYRQRSDMNQQFLLSRHSDTSARPSEHCFIRLDADIHPFRPTPTDKDGMRPAQRSRDSHCGAAAAHLPLSNVDWR